MEENQIIQIEITKEFLPALTKLCDVALKASGLEILDTINLIKATLARATIVKPTEQLSVTEYN